MQALAERRLGGEQGKLRPLIIPPVFTAAAAQGGGVSGRTRGCALLLLQAGADAPTWAPAVASNRVHYRGNNL